jgi:hypothetical protein
MRVFAWLRRSSVSAQKLDDAGFIVDDERGAGVRVGLFIERA